MNRRSGFIASLSIILFMCSCKETKTLYELSPISETGDYHAIVSIPAGTSELYEYEPSAGVFRVKKVDDRDEYLPYLPFPVNYAFIPSTYNDLNNKDITDPIRLFIITHTFSKTTLLKIKPVATAAYISNTGDTVYLPMAVPVESEFRTMDISNYQEFLSYPDAMISLESFYRNWKNDKSLEFIEWKDEVWTQEYIKQRTDFDRINYRGKEE